MIFQFYLFFLFLIIKSNDDINLQTHLKRNEDGPKKPSTLNSNEGEIPDTCKSLVYNKRLIAIARDV